MVSGKLAEDKTYSTLVLPKTDQEWLNDQAKARGVPRAEIIREAIRLYQAMPVPLRHAVRQQEATPAPEAARA